MSCLKTAILAQRDCHQNDPNKEDKCIHCQQNLINEVNLPFKSIQEFKNHKKNLSTRKIIDFLQISWLVIFVISLSLSVALYSIYAKPKYSELCVNSNLTIPSDEPRDKEYLCDYCLSGKDRKRDRIDCPSLMMIGISCYMGNFLVGGVFIVTGITSRFEDKLFKVKALMWWGLFWIVVRCATIGIYYGSILNTLTQIDDFSQLYNLQMKFILTDLLPLLLVCMPVVLYLFYWVGLLLGSCFGCSKECWSSLGGCQSCKDCYNSYFHYSHHNADNPITNLSISINDDDLKENKNNKNYSVV